MEVSVEPMSRKAIRRLTRELREIIGLEKEPYFPIVKFIEWVMAHPESNFNFEVVPESHMQDTYGLTNTVSNAMLIREDVYIGAANGNPRDRFTLCHELGHYLLHQPERCSYARGEIPAYRKPEWQANTFAGELMAPYDLVAGMSIEEIMEACGMSREAATIQWKFINDVR